MKEFDMVFKKILKEVNGIIDKKKEKYPMLDIDKIKKFLLSWTKHHLSKQKNKCLKTAFYFALVTFETTCNLAQEKSNG